jgi:hypothetical protein
MGFPGEGGVQTVGKKEHRSGLFLLGPGVFLPLSAAGKVGVEPLVAKGRAGDGRVEIVQIKTSTRDLYGCSDMLNTLSPRNNH